MRKNIDRISRYLSHPMFWLLLVFVYGLYQIDLPPIDRHNWRQALTLMIARNFYMLNNSILYPQYDIGGVTDGIIPTEFPLFNYITSLFYHVFGLNDWSARLINWMVTCTGFYYFYLITKKLSSKPAALAAMLMMVCSVILVYGRKAMPDTFALSLTIIGVYYYWKCLENYSVRMLLLGCVFLTLGVLSKIPMVSFAALLVIPVCKYRLKNMQYTAITASLLVFLLAVVFWYFYWMPYLEEQFGNKLIWPVSLKEGLSILMVTWPKVIERICSSTFHNPVLIALSVVGLFALLKQKKLALLTGLVAYLCTVVLFIVKTGHTYYLHDYYTISIVPFFCILIACCWDWVHVPDKWKNGIILLLLIPSFINQHSIIQERQQEHFLRLPNIMNKLPVNSEDKIMVTGGSVYNPAMMYFTERQGWSINDSQLFDVDFIEVCLDHKLKYIVVDKHRNLKQLTMKSIYEDEDFVVYLPEKTN